MISSFLRIRTWINLKNHLTNHIKDQKYVQPIQQSIQSSIRSLHISTPPLLKANQLPPRPKINEEEIEEVFLKGGGKGGQKINKTNSKVQLKHIPTGIVVSSQFSRSREQNRAKAREILAMKVEEITAPPGQSRAEIVAKYKQNKARTKKRKAKRKYLALAEEKAKATTQLNNEQLKQEDKT